MTTKEKNVAEEVYDNPIFEIFGKPFKKLVKKIILCQNSTSLRTLAIF